MFVVIALICVIVLILKVYLGIDRIHWLLSKFGFLNDFWVRIKSTKPIQTNTKCNKPGSNQDNPNNNSGSILTPEEKSKKIVWEYSAKRRKEKPEKIKENRNRYVQKNKEAMKAKDRERYKNNEERRNSVKNYRKEHAEQVRANDKKNISKKKRKNRTRA